MPNIDRGATGQLSSGVLIGDDRTRVMCEMVGAVDARVLGDQVGRLTVDDMRRVDDALELVVDLD
jgi:mRNA interferase MazF